LINNTGRGLWTDAVGVRGCGYGRLMTERTGRPTGSETLAEVGIIGGSGFYSLLDTMTEVDVDTPWETERPDHCWRGGRSPGGIPPPART
jgi:hypothetical protein